MIEAPMLIFTNLSSNYPIQGLEDNVPGVCYRTGPKGWMDQALFAEFFVDPWGFQADIHGHQKLVWVDNYTGHNITPRLTAILEAKHNALKYLPPCSTHLYQPANTFIILKVKDDGQGDGKQKKLSSLQLELGKTTLGLMDSGLGS